MKSMKTILLGIAFLLLAIYCGYIGIEAELNAVGLSSFVWAPTGMILAIVGAAKKD